MLGSGSAAVTSDGDRPLAWGWMPLRKELGKPRRADSSFLLLKAPQSSSGMWGLPGQHGPGGRICSPLNRGPCRPAAQAMALLAVHSAGRQPRDFLILFFLHLSVFPRVDSPQITRVVAQQADPRQKQGRLLASPELIIIGELSQNSTCSSRTVGGSGLESSTAGEGEGSENNGAPACGANIVFARSGASIQWVHPKEQP